MPQLSTYGGVIVPSPQDGAVVPADLLSVVNQFCGSVGIPARINAVVASKAERDANYDGYPAGGIIVCPQAKTMWMSLGKSGVTQNWQTVYVDSGWITSGFGFGDQWSAYSANSVRVRRKGPNYTMQVRCTFNGSANIVADGPTAQWPGNITDTTVISSAPSDYLPTVVIPGFFFAPYTNGACVLNPSGTVVLRTMNTSSIIMPSQDVTTQFMWPTDD